MLIELGLLMYGVYALISRRFSLGRNIVLTGKKAGILGVLCLSPLPVALLIALFWILTLSAQGIQEAPGKVVFTSIFIEAGVVLVVLWFLVFLGNRFCSVPAKTSPMELLLLTLAVLLATLMDVKSLGYKLAPVMFGEQLWAAAWGVALGALGGGAFGMCAGSELRRQAKRPENE